MSLTCGVDVGGTKILAGVVDQDGRVYGLTGLRVADASVIPMEPAANTMLPTVMTAERLAAAARGRSFPEAS